MLQLVSYLKHAQGRFFQNQEDSTIQMCSLTCRVDELFEHGQRADAHPLVAVVELVQQVRDHAVRKRLVEGAETPQQLVVVLDGHRVAVVWWDAHL